ncbi:MAG: phosphate/phosphite/phosphonate ABC transporter substrate-binding protein [Candidatus Marinimicrobia bacterium]|nr:phosphate/phosphite/phosphonate ABC transporter substrate-binding protein [Candidatus Neomarinimicrobiota bacterium]
MKITCFATMGMVSSYFFYSCDQSATTDQIKTETKTSINVMIEPLDTVYFGFITRYNPRIMYEEYQPIMDYLSRETPYLFEIKLGKTYQDAVNYLENDIIQIASFGAVTYVEAHSKYGAIPILKPLNSEGEPNYRSLIVVRKDSDILNLKDLKNRTFAFASVHSTSGNLVPRYTLAGVGLTLENLSDYKNLKHHDSVAKAVLSGEYDAGAMKDIVAYKYLEKGLRILDISDAVPSVPFVIKSDLDSTIVKYITKALLKIDVNVPEYQTLVSNWNPEFRYGFTETQDADYQIVRDMLNAIPGSCGNTCHPGLFFK